MKNKNENNNERIMITMKRIVLFVLTAMLLLNTVPVLAASSPLVQAEGTITAVDTANNQITVTLSDKSEMVFNVSSSTLFLSAKDGSNLALKDLAAGMTFTAFHSAATTRSLPPQSALHTMIVVANSNEDFAHDFTVQGVESSSNGLDLLNDKGDTILHVSSSTNVYTLGETGLVSANAADMKAGARLIAWYDVVAMSYPGQANPSKVLVLSFGDGSSPSIPPKTGDAVSDTLAFSVIALSLVGLAAWTIQARKEK